MRAVSYFVLQNGGRHSVTFTPAHRDRISALASSALNAITGVRVHAFSWTTSELRMVLEGGEPARRKFVRELSSQHRQALHADICGHECLFDRSPRETSVQTEQDLLHVVEHIHAAPVRAGLVSREADYPWSSSAAYEGTAWFPWLTTDFISALMSVPARPVSNFQRRAGLSEPAEASRPQF